MYKVLVTGSLGSGKTTLCNKICTKNIFHFPRPIYYISADILATHIRNKIFPISKNKLLWLLFYSPLKNRHWNQVEESIHPILTKNIERIINEHKKGTALIDAALEHVLPKNIIWNKKIKIPSKAIYPTVQMLKKYRKKDIKYIFEILKRQTNTQSLL